MHWKGAQKVRGSEDGLEDLFCSADCEDKFWAALDGHRGEIERLLEIRRETSSSTRSEEHWDEDFALAWWHQARYMGVRRRATDPHDAAWHEHYYALGQMISRAAEWEFRLGSAFAILMGEEFSKYRDEGPKAMIGKFRRNAHRWPHLEASIERMCDAADGDEGAIVWRNWMVHSTATPSWSGQRAVLHKSEKKQKHTGQRVISVDQTQRLAARFRWLLDSLTRILDGMHADERPVIYADPLGPPPPIGSEVSEAELVHYLLPHQYREGVRQMSGVAGGSVLRTLAELRPSVVALLTRSFGEEPGDGRISDLVEQVVDRGIDGQVAAAVLCASACQSLARELERPPGTAVALVSRVVPWRHDGGKEINAILSAYVHHNPKQAHKWIEKDVIEGRGEALARGIAERLVFCVEATGLLAGPSTEESSRAFLEAFFDGLGA